MLAFALPATATFGNYPQPVDGDESNSSPPLTHRAWYRETAGKAWTVTAARFVVVGFPFGFTDAAANARGGRGDYSQHGQKILRTAEANGVTPQEWCDKLVEEAWKPLWAHLNIANDDFVRTTQERHTTHVRRFVQDLYDKGEIYLGGYQGPYCVACEEYKTPGDLIDGPDGNKLCAIHRRPVEMLKEENYFFKLSEYADKLLRLYEDNPDFIQPESARNEVVSFVQQGLQDLSISRSTFDWGVKIPWDEKHVIYV